MPTITADNLIRAFSLMLIHSLWQGLLLAMVTVVLLNFTRRASSAVRYNLLLGQFLLFVLCCGYTFIAVLNNHAQPSAAQSYGDSFTRGATQLFSINAAGIKKLAYTCTSYFAANAPMIALLWFVLFVFRSVKFMGGLVFLSRARTQKLSPATPYWQQRMAVLCQKLQLKKAVQLMESGYVKVPIVIGHLKPLILIPAGLLAGLPPAQVEAVLLHELAHIRRNDYFVNFLQTLAETVFFFNPALMWISALLREERENCCDDMALAQINNKRELVEALIGFKEYALYGSAYQVAFPGKRNHLLNRISRIMQSGNKAAGRGEKTFLMLSVLILSAAAATAAMAQFHSVSQPHGKTVINLVSNTVSAAKVTKQTARPALVTVPASQSSTRQGNTHKLVKTSIRRKADRITPPALAGSEVSMMAKLEADRALLAAKMDQNEKAGPYNGYKTDQQKAAADQRQAKLDAEQAALDQRQAARDQLQAAKDMAQAKRDQQQAALDMLQAMKDQQQAKKDRQRAENEKPATGTSDINI